MYSSTNYGATWFPNETIQFDTDSLPGLGSVASSADGNYLFGNYFNLLINPPPSGSVSKPPKLNIAFVQPGSVVVFWPNTGNYTLQQNSNLATTAGWMTSGYPITTADGTNSITISPPAGDLFFRLSNP